MLRCPPSSIGLNASDVAGLDQRLAARHSTRLAKQNNTEVRLTAGPSRLTRHSIVSARDNVKGGKGAESSSSEDTPYKEEEDYEDGDTTVYPCIIDDLESSTPSSTQFLHQSDDPSALVLEALENVSIHRGSPAKPSPQHLVDNSYGAEQTSYSTEDNITEQTQIGTSLDGTVEQPTSWKFVNATPLTPFTRRGNQVLGEIIHDAYPSTSNGLTEPRPDRPLLSSARARRRHARSQDIRLHEDNILELGQVSHHPGQPPIWEAQLRVPELQLPSESEQSSPTGPLDPLAAVFQPRTRFGSAARSSAESGPVTTFEPHWGSLDTIHNVSNLRMRSTSERNVEGRSRWRQESILESLDVTIPPVPEEDLVPSWSEHHRMNRGDDQNSAIPSLTSDLDRYPLLRPSSSLSSQRRTSVQPGTPWDGGRASSASSSTLPHGIQYLPIQPQNPQTDIRLYPAFINSNLDPSNFSPRSRSVSPAISTISRSTPNLLTLPSSAPRISSRGSSWSWKYSRSRRAGSDRIPSMVSGASGASTEGLVPPSSSSQKGLDAAEEFIRRRNSPLDELTERISRMRSVGRSWERIPRPALLSGDPFGDDGAFNAGSRRSVEMVAKSTTDGTEKRDSKNLIDDDFAHEDPVALSLALPPSSPLPSCPEETSAFPYMPGTFPKSPPSPLSQRSPTKSCASRGSAIKRKPVPRSTNTSKFNVYDDNQPLDEQPQTPADMMRSRRTKNRSNTATGQSTVAVGNATTISPPTNSDRHVYRNTYPPIVASQGAAEPILSSMSATGMTASVSRPEATHQPRRRRGHRSQRSSGFVENDVEGQLSGLEEDRRIWLNRREAGTLDITPPKEGRFERFLS